MSTAETAVKPTTADVPVRNVDMKLEVVVIPVSDVDRARDFYVNLDWRVDADVHIGDFRLVQLTPPGSECSVQFGTEITPAAPGSAQWVYLVVSDIKSARADLAAHGVAGQRGFPRGEARRPVPRRCPGRRTTGRWRELRFVHLLQRPRWQYLASPRGHPRGCRAASTPLPHRSPR